MIEFSICARPCLPWTEAYWRPYVEVRGPLETFEVMYAYPLAESEALALSRALVLRLEKRVPTELISDLAAGISPEALWSVARTP